VIIIAADSEMNRFRIGEFILVLKDNKFKIQNSKKSKSINRKVRKVGAKSAKN
jgi:hypothetical protein